MCLDLILECLLPRDPLWLPEHALVSRSTDVKQVVAPASSVGVARPHKGLLQVLISRLIQEDKVVVVTTQGEDKEAKLDRLDVFVIGTYCEGVDQVYNAVRGLGKCLAPSFSRRNLSKTLIQESLHWDMHPI